MFSRDKLVPFATILFIIGIIVAGPFNWFYSDPTGTHFDKAQFFQPISLLGMAMVIAAFVLGYLVVKKERK